MKLTSQLQSSMMGVHVHVDNDVIVVESAGIVKYSDIFQHIYILSILQSYKLIIILKRQLVAQGP